MAGTCPAGHRSATDDYCDQCGAPMRPGDRSASVDPGGASGRTSEIAGAAGPAPEATKTCVHCGSPAASRDRFCEVCGYDFVSGEVPPAAEGEGAMPGPAPEPASDAGWRLVVDADRDHYDRMCPDGVPFPVAFTQRVFEVCGDVVVVGRGDGRGPGPDIDLAGEPEDVAVSRRHVLLERAPDGSYTLLDPGSTNGTLVNEADQPLPLGHRIVLKDNDRLFIGAWTRIVVRTS